MMQKYAATLLLVNTFMIHNTRQWFVISGEWLATYQ
jgi:hypothetical protein